MLRDARHLLGLLVIVLAAARPVYAQGLKDGATTVAGHDDRLGDYTGDVHVALHGTSVAIDGDYVFANGTKQVFAADTTVAPDGTFYFDATLADGTPVTAAYASSGGSANGIWYQWTGSGWQQRRSDSWTFASSGIPWPNAVSAANSDPWLARHHDAIAVMRPQLLVLNFRNGSEGVIAGKVSALTAMLREATRYHGYADASAPTFLDYQVARVVNLTDQGGEKGKNSSRYPFPVEYPPAVYWHETFHYAALYDDTFAKDYGFFDALLGRYLRLGELLDRGLVHEVWICSGDDAGPYESVELKQAYDSRLAPLPGVHTPSCGNGLEHSAPWTGRSVRFLAIGTERGAGNALHCFGHTLEALTSKHDLTSGQTDYAIPYFGKYGTEFWGNDLQTRFASASPAINNLYATGVRYAQPYLDDYPAPSTLVYDYPLTNQDGSPRLDASGKQVYGQGTIKDFYVVGGNTHFPPNGRYDYDYEETKPWFDDWWSDEPVLCTIEHYRRHDAPDGTDIRDTWTRAATLPPVRAKLQAALVDSGISTTTPPEYELDDGGGVWLTYWMQNMPGLANRSIDDDGKPMKNWWVFLFY